MKKNFILLLLFIFFTGCQSAKDALTLKKKASGDEFLIEKKSPLVLPPDYGELPIPGETINEELEKKDNEIIETLSNSKILIDNNTIKNTKQTPLEKSVLDKIK